MIKDSSNIEKCQPVSLYHDQFALTNSERDCVYLQHCGFLNSVHSYDMFYTILVVCDIAGKSHKKVVEKGKKIIQIILS